MEKKLARMFKNTAGGYVTGDHEDWTYKYTWEDYLVAVDPWNEVFEFGDPLPIPNIIWGDSIIRLAIAEYFMEHPEELMDIPEIPQFHGVTREHVIGVTLIAARKQAIAGAVVPDDMEAKYAPELYALDSDIPHYLDFIKIIKDRTKDGLANNDNVLIWRK